MKISKITLLKTLLIAILCLVPMVIYAVVQVAQKSTHNSIPIKNPNPKEWVDLRPYLQSKDWKIDPDDYQKRLINSELTNNEKLFCEHLGNQNKNSLLDRLHFTPLEKLTFAISQNQDKKCAVYLSAVQADNLQGVHAISQVFFGTPFGNLTHCGLLKVARLGNLDLIHLEINLEPSSDCNVDEPVAKNPKNHPLDQAKTYRVFTNSIEVPLSEIVRTVSALKQSLEDFQANPKIAKNFVLDISLINLTTKHQLRYTHGNSQDSAPMASLGKLFIIDNLLKNNKNIQNNDVRTMLCQSEKQPAIRLFAQTSNMQHYITQYQINTQGNIPQVVFTSELQGITTDQLQNFLVDFYQTLQSHQITSLPNALGKNCTAGKLQLPKTHSIIFAKTGTGFSNGKIIAKLLTIAYTHEQTPYVMLLRIHHNTGICAGDNCFDNVLWQPTVKALSNTKI